MRNPLFNFIHRSLAPAGRRAHSGRYSFACKHSVARYSLIRLTLSGFGARAATGTFDRGLPCSEADYEYHPPGQPILHEELDLAQLGVRFKSRFFISPLDWSVAIPSAEKLDTHQKALTVNLDPSTFGSFAKIAAGQEVARWFLVVGGAGTVAKTISAYDKEVSDDLYGSGSRYSRVAHSLLFLCRYGFRAELRRD
jgi:hypothetical protein